MQGPFFHKRLSIHAREGEMHMIAGVTRTTIAESAEFLQEAHLYNDIYKISIDTYSYSW